jgi:hypothetical protein
MRRSLVVASAAAVIGVGACRAFVDLEGLGGGDARPGDGGLDVSTGVDSGSGDAAIDSPVVVVDAGTDAEAGTPCPSTGGPAPVRIPLPDGGSFCIDSTEVTNVQYEAFLAAGVSTANQGALCNWNTTYTPSSGWPYPMNDAQKPVGWVDWCDAQAFCKWAGKRLCASIGGSPLTPAAIGNPLLSEYVFACSKGGERLYPYGSIYEPTKCNGAETASVDVIENVKSRPGCEGGFPGVFDLGGNSHEWVDGCILTADPATDECGFSASSYSHPLGDMACTVFHGRERDGPLDEITIRCCSD